MKIRIFSCLLVLLLTLETLMICPTTAFAVSDEKESALPAPSQEQQNNGEDYITGMVEISCNGDTQVFLERGDKLYAITSLDPSLEEDAKYSWEIMTDSGKWSRVSGYVFYFAVISEALLFNAAKINGAAYLRCIVSIGEDKYVSNTLAVMVPDHSANTDLDSMSDAQEIDDAPLAAAFSMRSQTQEPESDSEETGNTGGSTSSDAFQIVINYTYRHASEAPGLNLDGTNAANTFTVTLPPTAYYTGTVATPLEIGYLPYVKVEQVAYVTGTPPKSDYITYDGVNYVLANSINFENQTEDITIDVYFIPQEVTFRIKIYEQNLYDDEYTLAETITKTGIANSPVGEGYDTPRVGFTSLYYDPNTSIDEDGSFAIEIYYDRIYYLVDFDLNDNDEAFGVTNHYVRYKSTVVLPPPTRPGYSFINWVLTSVKVSSDSTEQVTGHSYPATAAGGYIIHSVEHNLNYRASWETGKTSYTVIYWLENADDDSFTLDSFKTVSNIAPGTVVSAVDDLAIPDAKCFTFNPTLSDKNVTVAADGTTAVNAYYLRNYYTMTFSGSSICITKEHTHNDECRATSCGIPSHTHTTKDCGNSNLTCTKPVHVHVDGCCEITEHIHDANCCDKEYHVHGTGASSDCTKPEHPLHHDTCFSRNTLKEADSLTDNNQKNAYATLQQKIAGPLNGYVYRMRLKRNSTIYNFLYVHNRWFYLGTGSTYNGVKASGISNPASAAGSYSSAMASAICGYELHAHGDGNCTCPITEHDHTSDCTCPEERHAHGEGQCVYSVCGMEQHRHTVSCYEHLCGMVEHSHGGNCVRACQQVEHTHTSSCQTKKTQNFLKFTAKYNADISKIWKSVWVNFTNGERWKDKSSAYFSEVLVYLPFMPPANITFEENDGTANKIFNIKYYLESLDTTEIEYQGRYFDLNNTVNAKYNYLTREEDFFDIPGFTQLSSNPAFSNNQISDPTDVSLYYKRNEYLLEFVSLGTTLSSFTKTLKYQQPIGESLEVMERDVPYPSSKEAGAIRFAGWYSTPNCADGTEFIFDGHTTMPIGGLVLYAKWETCSYTVNVYSNVEKEERLSTETVFFDSFIEEPDYIHIQHPGGLPEGEHPGYGDENHLIFAGWYYMVNGEEKRFDFNTMSVKFDMEIYAKWTSRVPVNYTVRYVYFDGTKYVDIAKPTTGASLAGITKHFVAKVTTELDEKYRVNYFPDIRSHSMTMSNNEEENVFLFVYSSLDEIKYTVNHKFVDTLVPEDSDSGMTIFEEIFGAGNSTLDLTLYHGISGEHVKNQAASIAVSFREGVTKANIILAAKEQYGVNLSSAEADSIWDVITKSSPNYFIQNLILTTDFDQNSATFTWGNIGNQARYQIIYYKESIDGSEFVIHSTQTGIVAAGTEIDVQTDGKIISIEYFDFDPDNPSTKLSGKATATSIDPETGVISQGLVLKLYYTRKEYTFTVHYYKQGTTTSLADPIVSTAKYQHTISVDEVAKQIPGYTLINSGETVNISANDAQTIECFYQGLEVNYQYQVMGMGATIDMPTDTVAIGGNPPLAKSIELWNDGYFLNAWYYSIGDGERQPVPADWLSNDNTTISLPAPDIDMAGKTVYVFAEVLPTTRRFRIEGLSSPENDPQAFVFRLKGKAGTPSADIDVTFTIFDIGHTDVSHLPYGEYTLTTLHWAWRVGHPLYVSFNDEVYDATSGMVTLNLNTTGEVVLTYSPEYIEEWLSDDASGVIPLYTPESRGYK